MKRATVFPALPFLVLLILAAACTQPAATPAPVTTPPAPGLSSIALTAADAPANYTFAGGREKSPDEVGNLAKSLGWQNGYVVTYTGYPDDVMGETNITQTITTYPAAGLSDIFSMVRESDRGDKELVITDLPSPRLGRDSFAFYGKATSQLILHPKEGSPLEGTTLQSSFKQDVVEIVFIKGTNLEVLKMTGPRAAYPVLLPLAQKAAARIP